VSILDLHADELVQAGRDTPFIPQPKPRAPFALPEPTIMETATAGVTSGIAKTAGFWSEVVGAFGETLATTEASAGGMFSGMSPAERTDAERARAQMVERQIEFSSEAGDTFRGVARSLRPDPQTANAAEQIVFGFGDFASRAIGHAALGGPVVGATLMASDEALAAADELKRQGVDLATRAKAAAVQGLGAGVSVALPMAGRTLLETVGLVAAGGPVTFIAQQAATRAILQHADYDQIALQYDPLDPVGLAVSTLVPAIFGAHGLRVNRARAAAKADAALLARETPGELTPVARAVSDAWRPTVEQVDAARVALLVEHRRAASLVEPVDIAGQARHERALELAEEQLERGEPVRVTDVAAAPARAAEPILVEELAPVGAEPAEPPAPVTDPLITFADRIAAGARAADREAKAQGLPPPIAPEPAVPRAADMAPEVRAALKALDELAASGKDIETFLAEARLPEEAHNLLIGLQEVGKARGEALLADYARSVKAAPERAAVDVAADVVEAARQGRTLTPEGPAAKSEAEAMTERLAAVGQQFPDLVVRMDDMDKPMRLADILERVQREADAERADAPDFMAAAQCSLVNG
jgi:hypothetical protein